MAHYLMSKTKKVNAIVDIVQDVVRLIDVFEVMFLRILTFGCFVYEVVRVVKHL